MPTDAIAWGLGVLEAVSAAGADPMILATGLAALTLLFEDAAIAAGILLAAEGSIGTPLAVAAVAGGIAGGDLLLYLLGVAARRTALVRRHLVNTGTAHRARGLLDRNLIGAVLVARAVPGLRLAVYTASGLFAIRFVPFALLVLAAVAIWTGLLFWLGSAASALLMHYLSFPPWIAAGTFFALLSLSPVLAGRLAAVIRGLRR